MSRSILATAVVAILCLGAQADEKTETEVPPIPKPAFEDASLGEEYAQGMKLLEAEKFRDAEKLFKKLSRSVPEGEIADAVDRCHREARGGAEAADIHADMQKEKWKKALDACEKAGNDFEGTFAGQKIAQYLDICMDEVYFVIDDFEEAENRSDDGGGEGGGEGGDGGGEGGGGRGRWLGQAGYGLNAKVIEGKVEDGTVRAGEKALEWRTTRDFSWISFEEIPEDLAGGYRYLNLSIRAKDPKNAPQLRLLFDCEEGGLGWGGGEGGGRRGGRRGARALQRAGFGTAISTSGRWQDLRIDLRKFTASGDADWSDVQALRLIHMPGGDGRVLIDNVRLERK